MKKTENPEYKEGLAYICANGCGMEITVTFEGQGEISCCGKKMRRGRIIPKFKKSQKKEHKNE